MYEEDSLITFSGYTKDGNPFKVRYQIKPTYLKFIDSAYPLIEEDAGNDYIFHLLDCDKYKVCDQVYGYVTLRCSNAKIFPETRNNDKDALIRIIHYLDELCELSNIHHFLSVEDSPKTYKGYLEWKSEYLDLFEHDCIDFFKSKGCQTSLVAGNACGMIYYLDSSGCLKSRGDSKFDSEDMYDCSSEFLQFAKARRSNIQYIYNNGKAKYIIEFLESLGGKNVYDFNGKSSGVYYIDRDNTIRYRSDIILFAECNCVEYDYLTYLRAITPHKDPEPGNSEEPQRRRRRKYEHPRSSEDCCFTEGLAVELRKISTYIEVPESEITLKYTPNIYYPIKIN